MGISTDPSTNLVKRGGGAAGRGGGKSAKSVLVQHMQKPKHSSSVEISGYQLRLRRYYDLIEVF